MNDEMNNFKMKHIPSMDYVFQNLQWEGFNLIHMKFSMFLELFLPIAIFLQFVPICSPISEDA
jgi:hypothetical protein